jgi:hypothetical protein
MVDGRGCFNGSVNARLQPESVARAAAAMAGVADGAGWRLQKAGGTSRRQTWRQDQQARQVPLLRALEHLRAEESWLTVARVARLAPAAVIA